MEGGEPYDETQMGEILSLSYMGAGSPRDGFRDPDLVVLWFFFHLKCNPFQITRLWERLRLVEWGW